MLTVPVFLTLAMFIITTITCLALSPKQSSTYVWATFSNATGWDDGICFLTGLVTPCFMYAGLDATMHLAEECEEPRKTVPQALLSTVVIGFGESFLELQIVDKETDTTSPDSKSYVSS